MNREIKFRAWDARDKRMCEVKSFHLSTGKVNVAYRGRDVGLPDRYGGNFNIPADTVMQFTGLTDKNGKEIYEGDIVQFFFDADYGHGEKDSGYTEMIDTVEFCNGCFYFINSDTGGGAFAFRHNKFCEVIGNIYENSDLLK